jgi:hypothetical protein
MQVFGAKQKAITNFTSYQILDDRLVPTSLMTVPVKGH